MIRVESNRQVGEALKKFLEDKKQLELFEGAVNKWRGKEASDSQLVAAYNIYRSRAMSGEIDDF